MPAARGVKRTASKASAASKSSSASAISVSKNKKKRGVQLEVPSAPKKRGRVFTCGQGDVGQLGLGEDVVETTKFKCVSALGSKIVDACAGGMHTVALDTDGTVWTFGCNDEGALGRPTTGEIDEGTPKKVSLPHPAVAITAGDSHSAALLDNGDVYAWGAFRDSHGSMGLVLRGREGKPCREPVQIEIGEPAAGIASGGDHLVVLSSSGGVYTMGCGEQGQLGRLSQRSASRDARQGFAALLTPSKVTVKGGAARVWAGYHATFALDANDKMFAWGLNNYGQLGITGEKRKMALFAPVECDAFTGSQVEWRAVSCGQHHSIALDAAGQVYAVGRCEYGRLGLGDRSGDAETLEPVPKLQSKTCVSIAAGTSNSFAVTDNGEILSWGMGSEGQLGTGGSADASEPTPAVVVAGGELTPRRVSAGGQHTVLFMEDPAAQEEKTPAPEMETAEDKVEEDSEEKEEIEETPRAKRQKKKEQEEEVTSTSAQVKANEDKEKPKARERKGVQSKAGDRGAGAGGKQKVNGDKKKETAMEVDETDNPDDKKEDTATDNIPEDTEKNIETEQSNTADNASTAGSTEQTSRDTDLDTATTTGSTTEKTSRDTDHNATTTGSTEPTSRDTVPDKGSEPKTTEEHIEETKQSKEDKPEPMDESQPETETKIETETKSDPAIKETVANDVEMKEKPEVNGTEETEIVEPKSVDAIPTGTAVTTSA